MDKVLENKLREFIRKIFQEELEEITTTGDVEGYSTPYAFKKKKKK